MFSFLSVLKDGALLSPHKVSGPCQTEPEFRTSLQSQERTQVLGNLANKVKIRVTETCRSTWPYQFHDGISNLPCPDGLNPRPIDGNYSLVGGLLGARENKGEEHPETYENKNVKI